MPKKILTRPAWVSLVLVVVTVCTMIRFDRPLIRGDGVAYLAWLDTFVRDRDLDLTNQHARYQPVNTYQITWDEELARFVNIFPFGVAILQAPFFGVGGVLVRWGLADQNPDYFLQMQGVNQGYSLAVMFGANVMALLAMLLTWQMVRILTGAWTAALLVWGFFMGTPLLYYSTISPLNSHNPGVFLTTCLMYVLISYTAVFDLRPTSDEVPATVRSYIWVLLGVLAGLMVLVRWQLALVNVCVWGMLVWRRYWKGLIIATVVAAVVMLPLPIIWNEMFGKPFVVPYDESTGEAFFRLPENAHRVLLRMVRYSPILLLSLAGIPFLWRRDRKLALFSVVVIGTQLLINGSTQDWYAGDSYGARRMSELYVIYVLLAAAGIARLPLDRGWSVRLARPLIARVLLLGIMTYSIIFLMAFLVFTWTNPAGQFADTPEKMLTYFFDRPDRMEVIDIIFTTHLGPPAWPKPGP